MYDPDLMDDDDICAGLCHGFLLIRVRFYLFAYTDAYLPIADGRGDVFWEREATSH
jgi:hypothetical protein